MTEKEGIFNSLLDEEKVWVRVDWAEALSAGRLLMEGCGGCVLGGATGEGSYEMPEELWLMCMTSGGVQGAAGGGGGGGGGG